MSRSEVEVAALLKLSEQEVFEIVAEHIFTQGEQSVSGGQCRYRTDDGRKCAVGCLIPDGLYTRIIEGRDIEGLILLSGILPADYIRFLNRHYDLLKRCQQVHDGPWNWPTSEDMRSQLRLAGQMSGLDTAFLDKLEFVGR